MGFNGEIDTLLHLGLTNSQAKVYLALLRIGTDCKGTTIAQFANVPRQDVYRLLAELQQIGIVTKTLDRPTKYKAACAKDATEILISKKKADFSSLKREGEIFVKKTQGYLIPQGLSDEEALIITGRDAITAKIREASLHAQVTVKAITPYSELVAWLSIVPRLADEAISRGVKFQWITEKTDAINQLPALLRRYIQAPSFKLRFITPPIRAKLSLYDSNEVVIGMVTDAGFTVSPALYSNNSSIVAISEVYFEGCWENGVDVDTQSLGKSHQKLKSEELLH